MAKQKFYAVRQGRHTGIYLTWEACQKEVEGYKQAQYKSFKTRAEAQAYLQGQDSDAKVKTKQLNDAIDASLVTLNEDELVAFVDGSYDDALKRSSFGALLLGAKQSRDYLYRSFNEKHGADFIAMRNVSAELEGSLHSIEWAVRQKKSKVILYYDYAGIEQWATGQWRANTAITQAYQASMQQKMQNLTIEFHKVASHTGVIYNEQVDRLAKDALLLGDYKLADASRISMPLDETAWKTIAISMDATMDQVDQNQFILHKADRQAKVNLLPGRKSYLEGKHTGWFGVFLLKGLEMIQNEEQVIELLNAYTKRNISYAMIRKTFSNILPHYEESDPALHADLLVCMYGLSCLSTKSDYRFHLLSLKQALEKKKLMQARQELLCAMQKEVDHETYLKIMRNDLTLIDECYNN